MKRKRIILGLGILLLIAMIGDFQFNYFQRLSDEPITWGEHTYQTTIFKNQRWLKEALRFKIDSSYMRRCPMDSILTQEYKSVGICPLGWRYPTKEEWQGVIDEFDNKHNPLSLTPNGYRNYQGRCLEIQESGIFWVKGEKSATNDLDAVKFKWEAETMKGSFFEVKYGADLSCRCVQKKGLGRYSVLYGHLLTILLIVLAILYGIFEDRINNFFSSLRSKPKEEDR